ncbi:MAG TPA: hypothetical protein VFB43_04425 [Terracidiphilus sp.]|nr:hypothetical protein [Terracidiphilus sp.]
MSSAGSQTILLVIAAVVALALLVQAVVLLAIFLGARKAISAAKSELEDLRASVLPFTKDAREFFVRVAPKVEQTCSDVAALTHVARTQTTELQSAATEFIGKARSQVSRLDAMITNVMNGADRAGEFMSEVVNKPMRQVSGILASIRAVVDTLRTPEPPARVRTNHSPARGTDPEMFV